MDIPKIVHRIWFNLGKAPKPPAKYDSYRKSVEDLNPNWTFMEWDRRSADKLIKEHYPDYWPVWLNYKSEIYRIDAIRYFIMDHYGGLYIDQDIQMYESFDELLKDYFSASMIFVFSGHSKTTISNYFMASQQKHPFWMQCIKGLEKLQKNRFFHRKQSYFGVFFVCGPFYLNSNLLKWSKQSSWKKTSVKTHPSKVFQDPIKNDKRIVLLYKEAFYNPSIKDPTKKSYLKTYGHHDYVFSWNPGMGVSPDYAVIFASVFILIVIIVIIVVSITTIKDYRKYKNKRTSSLKDEFEIDSPNYPRTDDSLL